MKLTIVLDDENTVYYGHHYTPGDQNSYYCPKNPKCRRSVYKITNHNPTSKPSKNVGFSNFQIKLESSNVLNIVDSYAYDLQSLIGEVGGTLGLFLGLSMYSIVTFAAHVINKLLY